MTTKRRNVWMNATAQVAVFALLFQVLLGAFACQTDFSIESHAPAALDASGSDATAFVVCTQQGLKPFSTLATGSGDKGAPLNPPHSDCVLCLSHACCPNALAPPGDVVVLAPSSGAVALAIETRRRPSSQDVLSLHNRGPPSLLA